MNISTCISNVPGPDFPLYCAGARMVDYYALGVLTPGMGIFHLVFSYFGKITLSVLADPNFIGCFSDSGSSGLRNGNKAKKSSVFYQRLINLLDSRKVHYMTRNDVFSLLEKHGFSVVDMTDIGGLTYFYSQNAPGEAEFRASIETPVKYN